LIELYFRLTGENYGESGRWGIKISLKKEEGASL
jgi:hypothetical protein